MSIVDVSREAAGGEISVPDVSPITIHAPVAYSRRPRWIRPALWTLLAATALLYLWDLGGSGYAQYYAASVQAGTQSWKALLFASLDPGNAITVDKPPAAFWLMGLSTRLFGFGAWSMLVPQALMGVGSVALLYAAVRRASGPIAGLLAGALLALAPAAALLFRYNNPDALLLLLLVAAGYCTIRALDSSPRRWLVLAGTAIGFALLTSLEAFAVIPAIGLTVLIAAPGSRHSRIRNLLIGCAAMLAAVGWFVVLVAVWPADSRPYIDGFSGNRLLRLAVGDGSPLVVNEISWLLPAALIGLIAMLWFTRFAARTSRMRANLLFWGAWMVVSGPVLMAPAVAAVIAISTRELWRARQLASSRATLALMLVVTAGWDFILVDRTPDWLPWLRWMMLLGAVAVAAAFPIWGRQSGRGVAALCVAALLCGLGSAAAFTIHTVADAGHPEQRAGDNRALDALLVGTDTRWAAATVGSHTTSSLELRTGKSVMAIGGFGGDDNTPTPAQFQHYVADGQVHYFIRDDHDGSPGSAADQITRWVAANFVPQQVGDMTVYDLAR